MNRTEDSKVNFKWAIVGTGHAASKFVRDLKCLSNHTVSLVSSGLQERASYFREKNQLDCRAIEHKFLEEIDDIDAVYIASHSNQHFSHITSALSLGVPILCEKPLALKLEEVLDLYRQSEKLSTVLVEGLWTQFLPITIAFRDKIKIDLFAHNQSFFAEFGKEFTFDPSFRLFSRELSGGALYDLGIYPVSLAISLFGVPTLLDSKVERGEDGLILDFTAILRFSDARESYVRGSIMKNLSNEGRIIGRTVTLNQSFLETPSAKYEFPTLSIDILPKEDICGLGMWREALAIEKSKESPHKELLAHVKMVSLETHRILWEIDKRSSIG